MPLELFPTPEEAAMQGFSPAHCRVLAVEVDGKDGFVLLDTGPAEYRYLYGGTVEQLAGGWCGGIDNNAGGVGWTLTDDDRELGVVAACGEAPPAADAVRVEWRGERREPPVRNGVYLVTWWRERWPEGDWPQVTAFRIGDDWVIASPLMARSTNNRANSARGFAGYLESIAHYLFRVGAWLSVLGVGCAGLVYATKGTSPPEHVDEGALLWVVGLGSVVVGFALFALGFFCRGVARLLKHSTSTA